MREKTPFTKLKIIKFRDLPPKAIALIMGGLFLAIFGIILAYIVGLFALIVSTFLIIWTFIIGLIITLFALIWSFITALFAGTWLVTLITILTSWITTLFAWFATTWLGSIVVPIYNLILPIAVKIAPFFSIGNGSAKLMKWVKKFRNKHTKKIKQNNH